MSDKDIIKDDTGFEGFFSSLSEELSLAEKQESYKQLYREESPLIDNFITEATTDEEFINYLIEANDSNLAKLKARISSLLSKIKNKVARAFKQIFPYSIYTIGVGIGRSAKKLYGLFDSNGNVVVNPVLKTLKVNDSLKTVQGSFTSKKGINWDIHMSGFNLGKGSVVGIGQKKNATAFYFSTINKMPKSPQPLNAGKRTIIDSKAIKKLFEAAGLEGGGFDLDDEVGDEMIQVGQDIEDTTLDQAEIEKINKSLEQTASNVVGYKEYANLIKDKLDNIQFSQRGRPEQIQVYGDSGVGKTQIVEQMAKYTKANYFYVQLDKLDQSLLKGIGVISKKKEKVEGEEREKDVINMVGSDMFPSDRDDDGDANDKKTNKVKDLADDLVEKYEKGDGVKIEYRRQNKWIIFFDEFNRAPEDATTIAMNILNTGAIVSAITKIYDEARDKMQMAGSEGMLAKLPENSLIMQAMNTPTQNNLQQSIQDVNDMDIATVSRMSTGVTLQTSLKTFKNNFAMLPFWFEFKGGEKEVVFPRLPGIVTGYMDKLYKDALEGGSSEKEAQQAPFNQLRSFGGGTYQSAMDPRAWTTAVSDKMIRQAKIQWNKLSQEQKEKFEPGAKKLQKQIGKIVNKLRDVQKSDYENLLIADASLDELERLYKKDIAKDDGWKNLLFASYLNSPQRQLKWVNNIDVAAGFGDAGSENIDNMVDAQQERLEAMMKPKDLVLGFLQYKDSKKGTYENIKDKYFGANIGKANTIQNPISEVLKSMSGNTKVKTANNILKYLLNDKNYKLSKAAQDQIDKAEEAEKNEDKQAKKKHIVQAAIFHVRDTIKEMYKDMADSGQLCSVATAIGDLAREDPFAKELHGFLKEWKDYRACTTEATETMAKEDFAKKRAKGKEEE